MWTEVKYITLCMTFLSIALETIFFIVFDKESQ